MLESIGSANGCEIIELEFTMTITSTKPGDFVFGKDTKSLIGGSSHNPTGTSSICTAS